MSLMGDTDVHLVTYQYSTITYCKYFNQSWVSEFTTTHCKKKLACPRLRANPWHKHIFRKQLDNMSIYHNIARFSSRTYDILDVVFNQLYSTVHEFPPAEQVLIPVKEQLVTLITVIPLFAPVSISCLAGQYCSCRVHHWVRPLMSFLPRSLHSTFLHYESCPGGKKFPGQFDTDSSSSCNQNVWCLQQ